MPRNTSTPAFSATSSSVDPCGASTTICSRSKVTLGIALAYSGYVMERQTLRRESTISAPTNKNTSAVEGVRAAWPADEQPPLVTGSGPVKEPDPGIEA